MQPGHIPTYISIYRVYERYGWRCLHTDTHSWWESYSKWSRSMGKSPSLYFSSDLYWHMVGLIDTDTDWLHSPTHTSARINKLISESSEKFIFFALSPSTLYLILFTVFYLQTQKHIQVEQGLMVAPHGNLVLLYSF